MALSHLLSEIFPSVLNLLLVIMVMGIMVDALSGARVGGVPMWSEAVLCGPRDAAFVFTFSDSRVGHSRWSRAQVLVISLLGQLWVRERTYMPIEALYLD